MLSKPEQSRPSNAKLGLNELILIFVAISTVIECISCRDYEYLAGEFTDESSLARFIHRSLFSEKVTEKATEKVSCGTHKKRKTQLSRISGGYHASGGEYPSYVRVATEDIACGGVIISEWIILTSVHCFSFEKKDPPRIRVTAGSVELGEGRSLKARYLCLPTNITGPLDMLRKDIAILVTSSPIAFDEHIQPACLPPVDLNSTYQAWTVGFGVNLNVNLPTGTYPKTLQVLPVQKLSECDLSPGLNLDCYISSNPKYRGNACSGDSGGPVYTYMNGRQTVVGIVSKGSIECRGGFNPGIGLHMSVFRSLSELNRTVETGCQDLW